MTSFISLLSELVPLLVQIEGGRENMFISTLTPLVCVLPLYYEMESVLSNILRILILPAQVYVALLLNEFIVGLSEYPGH